MKAILLTAAGGPEALSYQEYPMPSAPDPHFIRVRLHAAGVNPVDYKLRQRGGFYPEQLPAILGCDGAGVVESVGSAVVRFKPGDAVYFCNGGLGGAEPGNYAEYTVLHEDYAALKPPTWSMVEAAALPLIWITAWEALVDRAKLQPGQRVLIHAAAGGVGHVAVQLAHHLGAKVAVTVSSPEKAALARRLGADHCIDYKTTDFVQATLDWTGGEGVEVVLDTVGGELFARSFAATKLYGHLVTLLEPPLDTAAIKLAKLRNLSLSFELMLTPMLWSLHEARIAQRRMLEAANQLIQENRLQINVAQTFPLAEAALAHARLEAGGFIGKLVLHIP